MYLNRRVFVMIPYEYISLYRDISVFQALQLINDADIHNKLDSQATYPNRSLLVWIVQSTVKYICLIKVILLKRQHLTFLNAIFQTNFLTLREHAYSNILKIVSPKNESFQMKNSDILSYFCSKHRLWVLVRTASARRF